jgi:hypothetical protein
MGKIQTRDLWTWTEDYGEWQKNQTGEGLSCRSLGLQANRKIYEGQEIGLADMIKRFDYVGI